MNKLKSFAASKRGRDTLLSFGIVIAAFIIVQALIAGGMLSSQIKGLLVPICAYVVMAVSLNLTVGILGELSLGHAGFMSVGAFAWATPCCYVLRCSKPAVSQNQSFRLIKLCREVHYERDNFRNTF